MTRPCLIAVAGVSMVASGDVFVGNGGDQLRMLFHEGRLQAAAILSESDIELVAARFDQETLDFVRREQQRLALDVAGSPLELVDMLPRDVCPLDTCLCTTPEPRATIFIANDRCRTLPLTVADAGRLLVHESVHHLGVRDEALADKVAMAVYEAWRLRPGVALGTWATPMAALKNGPLQASVTYAGRQLLVWGGLTSSINGRSLMTNAGWELDLETWQWHSMPIAAAPLPRIAHTAVWTGAEMVVYGGLAGDLELNVLAEGAAYNPVTKAWRPLPVANEALPRWQHTATMTPLGMIVFGGTPQPLRGAFDDRPLALAAGMLLDVATDRWRSLPEQGGPSPRIGHTAVWTGQELIVWGGRAIGANLAEPPRLPSAPFHSTNSGARFDPATDSWRPMSLINAPPPLRSHQAVWVDNRMIVWGETDDGDVTGAVYSPRFDMWRSLSDPANAPTPRLYERQLAVGIPNGLLVWGGQPHDPQSVLRRTGGLLNGLTGTWSGLPKLDVGVPGLRWLGTPVWTGRTAVFVGAVDTGIVNGGPSHETVVVTYEP